MTWSASLCKEDKIYSKQIQDFIQELKVNSNVPCESLSMTNHTRSNSCRVKGFTRAGSSRTITSVGGSDSIVSSSGGSVGSLNSSKELARFILAGRKKKRMFPVTRISPWILLMIYHSFLNHLFHPNRTKDFWYTKRPRSIILVLSEAMVGREGVSPISSARAMAISFYSIG